MDILLQLSECNFVIYLQLALFLQSHCRHFLQGPLMMETEPSILKHMGCGTPGTDPSKKQTSWSAATDQRWTSAALELMPGVRRRLTRRLKIHGSVGWEVLFFFFFATTQMNGHSRFFCPVFLGTRSQTRKGTQQIGRPITGPTEMICNFHIPSVSIMIIIMILIYLIHQSWWLSQATSVIYKFCLLLVWGMRQ